MLWHNSVSLKENMHYASKIHSAQSLQLASGNSLATVGNALTRIHFFTRLTFQIQIFGTIDNLSDHLRVHFQAVSVAIVPGDDDIVPLVVIQGAVTVALDHIGAISKVKHIVNVPRRENKQ